MVDPRKTTDAVISLIDAVTTVPVGDHVPSDSALPYVVVYTQSGGLTDGTLDDVNDALVLPIQLTVVSGRRDQCQWLQNLTRQAMLSETLTVDGYALFRVMLVVPSGVQRDDELGEAAGRRFYTTDLFHVSVVPS